MAVVEAVGFEVRDRRQVPAVEIVEEIDRVLDVLLPLNRVAHDRRRVLERVADVAVPVAACADEHVDRISASRCRTASRRHKPPP